jgi:hypothetical protein
MPDLRQVTQHDARIVPGSLMPVVTVAGGYRPDADN